MPEVCENCRHYDPPFFPVALNPPMNGGDVWSCPQCGARFLMRLDRTEVDVGDGQMQIYQRKVFTKLEGK